MHDPGLVIFDRAGTTGEAGWQVPARFTRALEAEGMRVSAQESRAVAANGEGGYSEIR